jgi:hypothetical protein
VNWSSLVAGLVPEGVVTKMSTEPEAPAGATAVILVEEDTLTLVAGTVPKSTLVAPLKLVPLMVTVVPPAIGPLVGEIEVTAGNVRT